MRTRIGIELTPVVCRVVEVADRGWIRRGTESETVVRSFGLWQASADETVAALAPYRGKSAAVVVWGAPNEHHQVDVALGTYEEMRAAALRILDDADVPTRGAWADIAPTGPADKARRHVIVTVAAAPAMTAAIQPLIDVGIRVRSAITPAAALAGIARARRAHAVPDAVEAYIALEETATCVALIRNGALMAARDLPWGFLDDHSGSREPRRREDITTRLGDDLADFFAMYEEAGRVRQLSICGGLPELRSTTLPLMDRFDAEVETLDSLFAIDAQRLPEPIDGFRDRALELRLAWAAATNWTTINLLRAQRRRQSQVMLSRAAVVAGVVFGFAGAWSITESEPEVPASAAHKIVQPLPPPAKPSIKTPSLVSAIPPVVVSQEPPPVLHEPVPVLPTPPLIEPEQAAISRAPLPKPEPVPRTAEPAPTAQVRTPVLATVAAPVMPRQAAAPPPKVMQEPTRSTVPPPSIRPEPPTIRQEPPVLRAASATRTVASPRLNADDQVLPFEAVLTSILFSPDRQLAIVDGRVVGRGDDVRGAIVIDVSPTMVLLRDSQGRLRRLSSSSSGSTR